MCAGWVSQITDKSTMTSVIQNHVTSLMTHWKGKIYAWVSASKSECTFHADRSSRTSATRSSMKMAASALRRSITCLGRTSFALPSRLLVPLYVVQSTRYGYADVFKDSNAKLYINDYNTVEYGVNYAKTQGMISKVKSWRAQGWPIDGKLLHRTPYPVLTRGRYRRAGAPHGRSRLVGA
jgi:endo-1,4-beta-xylanase